MAEIRPTLSIGTATAIESALLMAARDSWRRAIELDRRHLPQGAAEARREHQRLLDLHAILRAANDREVSR